MYYIWIKLLIQKLYVIYYRWYVFLDVKVVNQYIDTCILNTSVKEMYIFSVDVDNSTEKKVKYMLQCTQAIKR